jgi:hypothetical protein
MQAKMMLFDQFRQKRLDRGRSPEHFGRNGLGFTGVEHGFELSDQRTIVRSGDTQPASGTSLGSRLMSGDG